MDHWLKFLSLQLSIRFSNFCSHIHFNGPWWWEASHIPVSQGTARGAGEDHPKEQRRPHRNLRHKARLGPRRGAGGKRDDFSYGFLAPLRCARCEYRRGPHCGDKSLPKRASSRAPLGELRSQIIDLRNGRPSRRSPWRNHHCHRYAIYSKPKGDPWLEAKHMPLGTHDFKARAWEAANDKARRLNWIV